MEQGRAEKGFPCRTFKCVLGYVKTLLTETPSEGLENAIFHV